MTVLEFWFTGCEPCREMFPRLAQVYDKFKKNARVAIVGVSVDRPDVDDATIQQAAKGWGADFPLGRDTAYPVFLRLSRPADAGAVS